MAFPSFEVLTTLVIVAGHVPVRRLLLQWFSGTRPGLWVLDQISVYSKHILNIVCLLSLALNWILLYLFAILKYYATYIFVKH